MGIEKLLIIEPLPSEEVLRRLGAAIVNHKTMAVWAQSPERTDDEPEEFEFNVRQTDHPNTRDIRIVGFPLDGAAEINLIIKTGDAAGEPAELYRITPPDTIDNIIPLEHE